MASTVGMQVAQATAPMKNYYLSMRRRRRHASVGHWALSLVLASASTLAAVGCGDDPVVGTTENVGGNGGSPIGSAGADGHQAGAAVGGEPASGVGKFDDLVEAMGGPAPETDWTVFVYGHADHSLSNSLITDMAEMQAAELQGKVNVVVLADFDSSQVLAGSDPELHFPSGTEVYLIKGGGADVLQIASDVELDLDAPKQVERAIGLVFKAFPAKHHAVIMWDHGGSWDGGFGHDSQNGTREDSPGMAAQDIPPALLAGFAKAGVASEMPLDLFSFDTCLMAGAEVAYPFRNITPGYIANAEIDYGAGWDYTTTLSYMAADPNASPHAIAAAEVTQWDAHHTAPGNPVSDAVLRTHIALDASKLEALAQATSALTAAILGSETFTAADLARIAHNAAPAYGAQFETGSQLPGLHDFGQVLALLASTEGVPADIVDAATQASAALSGATIGVSLGEFRAAKGQAGFHIELGLGTQLDAQRLTAYGKRASEWSASSGWGELLKLLSDSADQEPPLVEHSIANGDNAGPLAIPTITFSSTAADVQSGRVQLAKVDDDGAVLVRGIIGEGSVTPGEEYEFSWDGHAVTVEGQAAMLLRWSDDGNPDDEDGLLKIPGFLKSSDGEEAEASLVFANGDETASYVIVTSEGAASPLSFTLAELRQMDDTGTFTPFLVSQNLASKAVTIVKGQPIALPETGELELGLEPVPVGKYMIVTQVFDVWGNQTSTQDAVTLSTAFEK